MALTKVVPNIIAVANNVTNKTVGNTTSIPSFTFDGAGVVTSASNVAISGAGITANTVANSAFQTGSVENYMRAQGSGSVFAGMRNRIINGNMTINQRGWSANIATDATYTLDRWLARTAASNKFAVQPTTTTSLPGFVNILGVTSQAATSVSAGDFYCLQHVIEGYNMADLNWGTANAKPITISFWVYSSLTGTFGGALTNYNNNNSYAFSYTIVAANTWEQKTITITGPTSGTFNNTNSGCINLTFSFGMGSTYSTTGGSWVSGNYLSTTGATNLVGTAGATWYITGVQFEAGSTPTPFEYRHYGTELALCQRYYFRFVPGASSSLVTGGYNSSSTAFQGFLSFPVSMRTSPTALEQTGTATNYGVVNQSGLTVCSSVPTFQDGNTQLARVAFTVSSGLTGGYAGVARSEVAAGFLAWSAEL